MKKRYLLNCFYTLIISLLVFGCDIKNPVDGLEVRLNAIARETLVTGYVYDASSGNNVEQNVSVTFTGPNAAYIVDETNESKSEFIVKGGFFNFAIKDGITISDNNPLGVDNGAV